MCVGMIFMSRASTIVDLYVATGESGPALAWAARAAACQPVPQAFLAEVHTRLGQLKEAELIVRAAASKEPDAYRRVPLFWQLAEIQVRRGELQDGLATLAAAREEAPDDASKAQCESRLKSVRRLVAVRQSIQTEEIP